MSDLDELRSWLAATTDETVYVMRPTGAGWIMAPTAALRAALASPAVWVPLDAASIRNHFMLTCEGDDADCNEYECNYHLSLAIPDDALTAAGQRANDADWPVLDAEIEEIYLTALRWAHESGHP